MAAEGPSAPTRGLLRASLTLAGGGALAQALPLLLGPLLTRLFTPAEFGQYHLFAAVAANLAVVACGRYEFALPMAADAGEADSLRRLAWRILWAVTGLSGLGARVRGGGLSGRVRRAAAAAVRPLNARWKTP